MSHQRKRFFSNGTNDSNGNGNGNGNGSRSGSPGQDYPTMDAASSTTTLPLHHDNSNLRPTEGQRRSFSGSSCETSPVARRGISGMDHSWSAGGSRRRTTTTTTTTATANRSTNNGSPTSTTTVDGVQRHHSGGSVNSPSSLCRSPAPRTSSSNGGGGSARMSMSSSARQRSSPQIARTVRRNLGGEVLLEPHSMMDDVSSNSHTSMHSTMDYSQQHHHHQHHQQQYSPSPNTSSPYPDSQHHRIPYGMLNPTSSSSSYYDNNKGSNSPYPLWMRKIVPSHQHHPYYQQQQQQQRYGDGTKYYPQHYFFVFGFCIIVILALAVYQHDQMLQEALHIKEEQVHHHYNHAQFLEQKVNSLRSQTSLLEERLEEMEHHAIQLHNNKNNNNNNGNNNQEVDSETQRKVFHLEHSNLKMQQDVQAMSKRMILEKFGEGPKFYVQMKLAFDPHSNVYKEEEEETKAGAGATILVETASIDIMPHSVHLFLEQVSHGLYDGTAFHINAPHIVQAGPSFLQQAHSKFRHHPSLNSVIFQEYAPEMAHKQYTIGYTGRPGGPDFYVNMRDNSRDHGPGGQLHRASDIVTDADPCFAKIVDGYDVLERVHRSTADEGGFRDTMSYPVTILEMKVLPSDFVLPGSASRDGEYF